MNYLAHIFLSGDKPSTRVGNFIGDFIKGKQLNTYPKGIREGIRLHRLIDSYTDTHTIVRETIILLRPVFGRYSGIVLDMYFDYFLASHFDDYSPEISLAKFSRRFYMNVLIRYFFLPQKVKGFIFHFVASDRLTKYATIRGFEESIMIMTNRKVSALDSEKTIDFLLKNQDDLYERFNLFFPDLIEFSKENLSRKKNIFD